ncbi:MAG: hypothetical protein ACLS4Z_02180 [Christensenellaceae bacterium]
MKIFQFDFGESEGNINDTAVRRMTMDEGIANREHNSGDSHTTQPLCRR